MARLLRKLQADDNVSGNQCVKTFNEIEVRRIRRTTPDRLADRAPFRQRRQELIDAGRHGPHLHLQLQTRDQRTFWLPEPERVVIVNWSPC